MDLKTLTESDLLLKKYHHSVTDTTKFFNSMDKEMSNLSLISEWPPSFSFLSIYPCMYVIEAEQG